MEEKGKEVIKEDNEGKNEEDELNTKEDKGEEKEENKHVGPKLLRLLGWLSRKGREQKKKRSMSLLMQR